MKKSALLIQDLSCYTRASINISMPILESANIEVALLPTTLLSTQSDGFEKLFSKDLTSECFEISKLYEYYNFSFDALYIGYLSNPGQYELVKRASSLLKKNGIILVDPVLGDNYELYPGIKPKSISTMKSLIKDANIICPNYTEALFLTDSEKKNSLNDDDIKQLLYALSSITNANIVITSIPFGDNMLANVLLEDDKITCFTFPSLGKSLPGSGDCFASLLLSSLLNKNSLEESVKRAGEITSRSIEKTLSLKRDSRYGVDIYNAIWELTR